MKRFRFGVTVVVVYALCALSALVAAPRATLAQDASVSVPTLMTVGMRNLPATKAVVARSAIFTASRDSTRSNPPEHSVLTGALIGAAVGGMYGAIIGTTRPTQCLAGTGYCDVSGARTRHVLQWTGEGLATGAVLGAVIGETLSIVWSRRGT